MAQEATAPVDQLHTIEVEGDPSPNAFWRRLGQRSRPEDVAALIVEECLTMFGARRALFASVDPTDGVLGVRFAVGFDATTGLRVPLSSDFLPVVAALLAGNAVALGPAGLLACGLETSAFADTPPGHGAVVPLAAQPLLVGSRAEMQPRCPLYRSERDRGPRCFLQKAPVDDPRVPDWETRIRRLCPECPVFGGTGIVLAERDRPFTEPEICRLSDLGRQTGQRVWALDILGRQERAFEKLKKEREWIDTVMVSAADPIVVTDTSGGLVLQNRRAAELLVAAPEDSSGKRRAIEINDITFSAYLSSLSIDPARAPRELAMVHPIDGTDLLFEAISTPAFSVTGQRSGSVTVLRDVSDLHMVTQELHQQVFKAESAERRTRQERDRLELVVRSAVEPIVVSNQANEIILTNVEGERLFQAGASDGATRQRAVVANDTNFSSFLTELMAGSELQRKRQLRLIDPASGEVRSYEVTAAKMRDPRSQPIGVVSVFHDLTEVQELERRRLEQKFFESEKLAATGRLAASIAHEVNNPLEAIKNSLFILKTRITNIPEGNDWLQFLEVARMESERVSTIMKQFLGFYRPSVAMSLVDVRQIVEYELRLVENQLHKRRVEVVRKLDKVVSVLASEDQLKQVFLNLILNAIEAMPKGGTLTLETREQREASELSSIAPAVIVTISDTGAGIQAEHMRSIFEPFFTTKSEKGTGLGLFVSYGIVKTHKGTIKVDTQIGSGTRFHVILPA